MHDRMFFVLRCNSTNELCINGSLRCEIKQSLYQALYIGQTEIDI